MRSLTLIMTLSILSLGGNRGGLWAQDQRSVPHTNGMMPGLSVDATMIRFATDSDLTQSPIPQEPLLWGMDVAWDDESNVRRGTNYIGKDCLQVGRVSFQPSDLIGDNGELSAAQQSALQTRLNHIALSGVKDLVLNCDHEVLCNVKNYPNCAQNYANYYGKPQEWLKVIKATVNYCKAKGFNVVTISPFNEPDYTDWKEGTQAHFKAIAKLLSEDPDLKGIRISAGNTLNCDQALSWYNAVKPYVSEGNTHQLAGSFDNYAGFWQQVRKDGNHATADELHNVGEAFIGAHYGMQTGIWWGWDGVARGEYCRASRLGKEIGYGENRSAWSAGTVYKRENGQIDAFFGTSERQATPSTFELLATDRPFYVDGYGPYYSYGVSMPGGTGYQTGQTNAEKRHTVQYGADVPLDAIQPDSTYVIVNANSGMCISSYKNQVSSAIGIVQRRYSFLLNREIPKACQWKIEALPAGSAGDLNYFLFRWVASNSFLMDVKDWSLSAGAGMIAYAGGKGTNEQWCVEYAGDNYWYIRSRHSGLYLEVKGASTNADAYLQQAAFTGEANQKWRFMPVSAMPALEKVAPAAPTGLTAQGRSGSVHLQWNANTEEDLAGYVLLRDGNVIARMVQGTEYIDNDVRPDVKHQYAICAVDCSRNRSEQSETVALQLPDARGLVMHYTFEGDVLDQTDNLLDAQSQDNLNYGSLYKGEGQKSLFLNGSTSRYLALPASVGYYDEMTLSMWVYLNKVSNWQRLFDFGNGTDQYIFLTPSNGSEMRLVMKNRGDEQILSTRKMQAGGAYFVAVTMNADSVTLYVSGQKGDGTYETARFVTSTSMNIRPTDILPKHNYIGWSQFAADPALQGYVDDVRLYNCAFTVDELTRLRDGDQSVAIEQVEAEEAETSPIYDLQGRRSVPTKFVPGMYITKDRKRVIK